MCSGPIPKTRSHWTFAEQYAEELRYVHLWGRWLRYDGTCWSHDDTLHVFDMVRDICREAARAVRQVFQHNAISKDRCSRREVGAQRSTARCKGCAVGRAAVAIDDRRRDKRRNL